MSAIDKKFLLPMQYNETMTYNYIHLKP